MESVIEQSLFLVEKVMNCRASSLMLLDGETGELIVSGARGPVGEQIRGERLPKRMGIAGWVAENGEPYYSNNPRANEVFGGDISDRFTTRNIICVPLYDSVNKIIGVLQAINRPHTGFSNSDVSTMEALAENIAISIDRAQQLQSAESELKLQEGIHQGFGKNISHHLKALLAEINRNLDSENDTQLEDLLSEVHTQISALNRYNRLFLSDPEEPAELDSFLAELVACLSKLELETGEINLLSDDLKQLRVSKRKLLYLGILVSDLLRNGKTHGSTGSLKISLRKQSGSTITLKLEGSMAEINDLKNPSIKKLLDYEGGLKVTEDSSGLLYSMEITS